MTSEPASQAATATSVTISLTVNGDPVQLVVAPDRRLAAILREDLQLTGTKLACEVGVCGGCTVLVDGQPTSSCMTLAVQVDGAEILSVEGLSAIPELARLQEAFVSEGGFQCGFCTSGQLVGAAPLVTSGRVAAMTRDEIAEHLDGNLCRCTGYYGILRAIRKAAG